MALVLKIFENTVSTWLSSLDLHDSLCYNQTAVLEQAPHSHACISALHSASSDSEILPHTIQLSLVEILPMFLVYLTSYTLYKALPEAFDWSGPQVLLNIPRGQARTDSLNSQGAKREVPEGLSDLVARKAALRYPFPRLPSSSFSQLLMEDGVSLWGRPHVNER